MAKIQIERDNTGSPEFIEDSCFLKSPDPDEMPGKLGYCYAIIAHKQDRSF